MAYPRAVAEVELEVGTLVAGYRVERKIGVGGMGSVYEVVHPVIGRRAAAKVIRSEVAASESGVQRFIQEARLVNRIRDPHIVDIFGFDQLPDGRPVLLMELLEGETLGARMARGRMSPADAIALLRPVLDALAAAHAAGIVHRDLKPENLFVVGRDDGAVEVKVLDFGIAKLVDDTDDADGSVRTGLFLIGTPKYMSPEQCRGQAVDGRSDLYSLGLILYEMLTARFPFEAVSPSDYYSLHLTAAPDPLGIMPGLDILVARLLAKSPDDRPSSASALARELRAAASLTPSPDSTGLVPSESLRATSAVSIRSATGEKVAPTRPTGGRQDPPPSAPANAAPPATSVERQRLCTVLHLELDGASELDAKLDLETARDVVRACLTQLAEVVEELGGVVDRFTEDGLVAAFGVSRATDRDAERAVRASLRLATEVAAFVVGSRALQAAAAGLELRAGMSTGRVSPASAPNLLTRAEPTLRGEPIHLASALVHADPSPALFLDRETYHQVAGLFDVESLPPVRTKGRRELAAVWRVLGPSRSETAGVVDDFEGREAHFIGRASELEKIDESMEQAFIDRRAKCLVVVGPAGGGKSRLATEVRRRIEARAEPVVVLAGRGSAVSRGSAYDLVADLLRGHFGLDLDDEREVVSRKISNGLRAGDLGEAASQPADDDVIDSLATMLGARGGLGLTALGESVDDTRARTRTAVAWVLERLSERAPVVLLVDALEVVDDASLDLIDYLLVRLAEAPLFVLGNARPELYEQRPHWGEGVDGHERLALAPLGRRALELMTRDLLGVTDEPPVELVRRLVERAEGNPLVLRETVRALLDARVLTRPTPGGLVVEFDRLDDVALPATIYGIVQARLDRLAPELRSIVQRAVVVGRVFWQGAIEAIEEGRDAGAAMVAKLEALRAAGVLRVRERSGFSGQREFVFADSVTRDVVYESLSRRVAERYHRAVGDWLVARGPSIVEANPALPALHYDKGGSKLAAVEWYVRAGARAASLGHNADAERFYRRACALADEPSEGPKVSGAAASQADRHGVSWHERVEARIALGDTLRRVGRLDEALAEYQLARAIIVEGEPHEAIADLDPRLVQAHASIDFRLGRVAHVRGAFAEALAHFGLALERIGRDGEPRLRAAVHAAASFTQLRAGKLAVAQDTCLEGLRSCRRLPRDDPDRADSTSRLLTTLGGVLYERGKWVRALRLYLQATRVVDEHRFPQLAAISYNNVAAVYFRTGDLSRARDLFARALKVKERIGDLYDLAVANNNLAEVELALGDAASAHEKAKRALQLAEALRASDALPDIQRNLGAILRARGDWLGAVRASARAFELAQLPAGSWCLAAADAQLTSIATEAAGALDGESRAQAEAIVGGARGRSPGESAAAHERDRGT